MWITDSIMTEAIEFRVHHLLVILTIISEYYILSFALNWPPNPDEPEMAELISTKDYYLEGEIIDMNCTLTSDYTGPCNASDLVFFLGDDIIENGVVTVLSEYTANIKIPNKPASSKQYMFWCDLISNGSQKFQIAKIIKIGRLPMVPQNLTCKLVHFENIVCSWSPKPDIQYTTFRNKVILEWTLHQDREHGWSQCPEPYTVVDTCKWDLYNERINYGDIMYIKIGISNTLGSVTSNVFTVDTSLIGHPPPLRIKWQNITSQTALLTWLQPVQDVCLLYETRIRSQYDPQEQYQTITVTNTTSLLLEHLYPYTRYECIIKTMPVIGGFWSDETSCDFTTDATVPSFNPKITRGSFEVDECPQNCKYVTVRWQKIPDIYHNGPGMKYEPIIHTAKHCLLSNHHSVIHHIEEAKATFKFKIHQDCKAKIGIIARNDMGRHMKDPELITIDLTQPVSIPIFSLTAVSEKTVHFIIKNESLLEQKLVQRTIYWCKRSTEYHQPECKDTLLWRPLSVKTLEYTLHLPIDQYNALSYIYAMSAETSSLSSGMIWSNCVYDSRAAPPTPTLDLSPVQPVGGLSLEWSVGKCMGHPGYINHYTVLYCVVDHCEEGNITQICQADPENHFTISSNLQEYTLTALVPEYHYLVRLKSEGPGGNLSSSLSDSVCWQVTQHWMTNSILTVMIFGCLIGIILVVIGIISLVRNCSKIHARCVKYVTGIDIDPPQRLDQPISSVSSQRPLMRHSGNGLNGYATQISVDGSKSGHSDLDEISPERVRMYKQDSRISDGSADDVFISDDVTLQTDYTLVSTDNIDSNATSNDSTPSSRGNNILYKVDEEYQLSPPSKYTVNNPGYGII